MQPLQALLDVLRPARDLRHRRGNFLQHLFGVYEILTAWGCSKDVCTAGLFHSVYGTEFFKSKVFDPQQRYALQQLIGPQSEALVYAFCHLSRNDIVTVRGAPTDTSSVSLQEKLNGAPLALEHHQLRQLRSIEMANLLEQIACKDDSPALIVYRLWRLASAGAEVGVEHPLYRLAEISESQELAALTSYHRAITFNSDIESACKLLNETVSLNCVVGEAQILLAATYLDKGEFSTALKFASQGGLLLTKWACAWDKRITLSDWLGLGSRITQLAALGIADAQLWSRLSQMLKYSKCHHAI